PSRLFTPLRRPAPPLFPYTTLFRSVPQRTALSHSLGALAACLVGVSEYFRFHGALDRVTLTALAFEVVVGGLTFTGSLIAAAKRSEEHTSELQSLTNIVCRLLLEKH